MSKQNNDKHSMPAFKQHYIERTCLTC